MKTLIAGLLSLLLLTAPPLAEAAKVEKSKGKRVLIDGEGDTLEVGQIYMVKNQSGKTVGLIKVTKVARGKALAVLGRGTARPGHTLQLRNRVAKKSGSGSLQRTEKPASTSFIGGVAGIAMSKADVDLFDTGGNPAGTASLDGNGFSAKAIYDSPLFKSLWFRGLLGMEQFNVSGATNAACGGACESEITYLTFDFLARLLLSEGTMRTWVGGGGSLLFPLSKSSTALKESSITNTNLFIFAGGVDFFLSPTTYIPVQIEYDMYPKSDTVAASAIAIRGGFAVSY